jgi:hypothetical protein
MAHPTEEALLALAHGELDDAAAAAIRAHCAGCAACTARGAAVRAEDAEIGRLLGALHRPVPRLPVPAGRARASRRRSAALAASLALLVAGAAAAAVPGTPLNRWLRSRLDGAPPTAPRAAPPASASIPPSPTQAASGVELPTSRSLVVAFAAPEAHGVVSIARTVRPDAALRAYGGDVAYQVGGGRISVNNRRAAGRYALEVPAGLGQLTVTVAGRVVFDSALRPVPADSTLAISLSGEPAR